MTERWNMGSSVLRGGSGSGTNTGSGSVGNGTGISLGHHHHGGSAGKGEESDGTGVGSGGTVVGATSTFSAANGESGILRRTNHYHHLQHGGTPENLDDLLVFGYSCKIFRDDERARFIDQGRHLIPWMGDNQLKIDRYDARGALHDLAPYEPPPGGYRDRLEGLTAAEQKAEQLCEEERYYSLYHNEVEEELYQEEARKRELMLGNQIAFNYDAPNPRDGTVATVEERSGTSADDEQDDDPYVQPKGFEIPPDIPLPETMKEHAIIEKTAKFIASQDAQMEILLKTKQANNPSFEFLNQSGRLFRYYRHVLLAFRTNQYPLETEPEVEEQKGKTEGEEGGTQNDEDGTQQTRPKIIVPAIKYKPSVDCAYTQLISKITGAPIPKIVSEAENTSDESRGKDPETDGTPTTVEVKKVSTGLAGLVQYDSDSDDGDEDEDDGGNDAEEREQKANAIAAKPKPPLAPFQGVVPASPIQHVIDRTAIYVAKNGYSFEEALRVKNDARFVFLNQAHEYYPYYAYRVRQRINSGDGVLPAVAVLRQEPSPPPAKVRTETENGTVVETTPSLGIKAVHTAAPKPQPVPVTNIQHQKLGAPVSFSLLRKQKDDGGSVKTVPGLGSDEDEDEKGGKDEAHEEVNKTRTANVDCEGTGGNSDDLKHGTNVAPAAHAEEVINENDLDGADVLEAASGGIVSVTHLQDREPAVSKEKQAERKKRANLFVNLIKHVDQQQRNQSVEAVENVAGKVTKLAASAPTNQSVSDAENGSIHSIRSTSVSPKDGKVSDTPPPPTSSRVPVVTTVIEDDDDDDVVLVSETRPSHKSSSVRESRSRSRHSTDTERTGNGADRGRRSAKKKKSKSRHRSTRGKKKSKKKSRTRSRSPSRRSHRSSCSRRSRARKRSRSSSESKSRSSSSSSSSRNSTEDSKRNGRTKRSKRSKRDASSRSRSVSRSRSRSRTHRSRSRSAKAKKQSRKRNESPERRSRKDRSRSRTSRRNSDSGEEDQRRGGHHAGKGRRRPDGGGHYEYDERYPPARARYWDC